MSAVEQREGKDKNDKTEILEHRKSLGDDASSFISRRVCGTSGAAAAIEPASVDVLAGGRDWSHVAPNDIAARTVGDAAPVFDIGR